jgi:hypothetical protein
VGDNGLAFSPVRGVLAVEKERFSFDAALFLLTVDVTKE